MLPFIAFLFAVAMPQESAHPKLRSVAEVTAFLKGIGYTYRPGGEMGVRGTLSRRGRSADVWLDGLWSYPGSEPGHPLRLIRLSTEFDVAKDLPLTADVPFWMGQLTRHSHYF